MIAVDQTFSGIDITLDGATFTRCTFERCKIVYSGVLPVTLNEPNFVDCDWHFVGPAAAAVEFMRAMYRAGAKDLIEKTCAGILSPADAAPTAAPVALPRLPEQKPAAKTPRKAAVKAGAAGKPH